MVLLALFVTALVVLPHRPPVAGRAAIVVHHPKAGAFNAK
jgi:hypothetical protein